MTYNPFGWHWQVGGDESRWWSSKAGAYVDTLPDGAGVTRIASEAELREVLAPYGLEGPADIAWHRTKARKELLAGLAEIEASIVGGYTEGERASWDRKLSEARAILAGESDPANYPIIAAEISMSGADASTIAQTIVDKAGKFEVVSGVISGARQKGEEQIEAAQDKKTVRSVPQAVIDQVASAIK